MKWSWKIGTLRGIDLYLHVTLVWLLGWILVSQLIAGHGLGSALSSTLFIALLFGCVVLHELGHALTAQGFGIATRNITLYPIGGVARLERIPRDPRQEFWIAIAGPAVNAVLAGALFLFLSIDRSASGLPVGAMGDGSLAARLMSANLLLGAFNLLPAFPMDGSRILRAFLASRMEYGRATQAAASVGQAIAFVFGLVGLMVNPFLLFIAFFVYMGAAEEANVVLADQAFSAVPVRQAMMTCFKTLAPQDFLARAMALLLAGAQHDFPVVENEAVVGILTRTALFEALARSGPQTRVAEVLQPAPPPIAPEEPLQAVFRQMQEHEAVLVPVVEAGRLVGLVTLENIGELLMLREALRHGNNTPPASGQAPLASDINGTAPASLRVAATPPVETPG